MVDNEKDLPQSPQVHGGGVEIVASGLTRSLKDGRKILENVSLAIHPGELVAIVGGSGAGKTTLLEALAGVQPATQGSVSFDGVDVYGNLHRFRSVLGYVPQEDIIHLELPLERTLTYSARLRLPASATKSEVDSAVQKVMSTLDLSKHAQTRVGALSGGQRKRASIAVELLTGPHLFFLDEPTSGLDPATSYEFINSLRHLASSSSTIVFTTHAIQDLENCDRVIFMSSGGRLAFSGSVEEALVHFNVDSIEKIYALLSVRQANLQEKSSTRESANARATQSAKQPTTPDFKSTGFWKQWRILTERSFETLARNRLTLAILLGSPAMVVAMFAILFQPGAFDPAHPSPSAIVMIVFWVTFGGFFFGVTYGLLQVVSERPILKREHLTGERFSAYLLAKLTVLLPFLLLVDVVMLAVLRWLDRLPRANLSTYISLGITLGLDASAALALGLLASAGVKNSSQATLALPMLCFPAVLFSGAILPVHLMAKVGAIISTVMPTRWSFEGFGVGLNIRQLLTQGHSSLGVPLLDSYGDAGNKAISTYWIYLIIFTLIFFFAALFTLHRTNRQTLR